MFVRWVNSGDEQRWDDRERTMVDQLGLVALCDVADVGEDAPLRVEFGGQDYAVYVYEDAYYVTADLCTHGPGLMSEGFQEGCEIECPFHQGRFNFVTGAVASPPCSEALRTWTAHLDAGKVWIDPGERRVA